MYKLLLFTLLIVLSSSIKLHRQGITGGWSTGDVSNPDTSIDAFIKQRFPDLANATLTKVETQVVSGINYRYTYTKGTTTWKVTVWDQPWTNTRQETGVQKIEKTTKDGVTTEISTSTQIETRKFIDVAKDLFKPLSL